jgi:hypothetical protein
MTTDITPENVARMLIRLRGTPLYEGHGEGSDAPDEAADMLEALAARLAEVEVERDKLIEWNGQACVRAEAAEALLAASEAREAKLREDLARSKRLRDQYREALDAERNHSNPARTAIEENKP